MVRFSHKIDTFGMQEACFLRLSKHLFNLSEHLCMNVCILVCMSYGAQNKHCFSLPKQK